MGSLLSDLPSPEFAAAFCAAAGEAGQLSFAGFMELALFHPELGYYRKNRPRIGYGPETDFFTATTSGPVFGELVVAACVSLLGGRDPRAFTFVELGAEPGAPALAGAGHPFGEARTIGPGETIALAGPCVVFSNELFDAQPFNRFVFRRGGWRELGVAWESGRLTEVELPGAPNFFPNFSPRKAPEKNSPRRSSRPASEDGPTQPLPPAAPEGYHLDAPLAAAHLLDQIVAQPWTGLFVACDYGKSWRELAEATPAGTARAYHRHRQSNDLLAQPGEQDLTCHVCWDWLSASLTRGGFSPPQLEFQESFFVRHAATWIGATVAAEAAHFSPKKLALMQLLHPSHLGQKFQVLHAWRE